MNNKVDEFVKNLNKNSFLQDIKVPVLDGFNFVNNPNTVFTAVNDKFYMEQFLTDGIIEENFEEHLNKVLEDTKNTMKESKLEDVDNSINFLEDYKNDYFTFKVYTQDAILDNKIIRQFNMFFMDKDTKAFFQVSLSAPPYDIKEKNFVNGELTTNMTNTIHGLMDNIKKETK